MPRTLDHIMACHQAASELRAAGNPIWAFSVPIRSILATDQTNVTPEHIVRVSNRIAAVLRSRVPATYFDIGHANFDFDFADAVDALEKCSLLELQEDKANGVEAVEMLNSWLGTIYDWADTNRVWLSR